MLLCFQQLNSVAMSGGIYLYDKVKSKLFFFSFQKETGYPSFSVYSASYENRVRLVLKKLQYCSLKQWLKATVLSTLTNS